MLVDFNFFCFLGVINLYGIKFLRFFMVFGYELELRRFGIWVGFLFGLFWKGL